MGVTFNKKNINKLLNNNKINRFTEVFSDVDTYPGSGQSLKQIKQGPFWPRKTIILQLIIVLIQKKNS